MMDTNTPTDCIHVPQNHQHCAHRFGGFPVLYPVSGPASPGQRATTTVTDFTDPAAIHAATAGCFIGGEKTIVVTGS
jgi:hypothetical protein